MTVIAAALPITTTMIDQFHFDIPVCVAPIHRERRGGALDNTPPQFWRNDMLPPRIPKKAKRSSRWRSQAHRNFVRSHYCSIPGCGGMPIEVAHVRIGSGAGISEKPDDWRTVSLCRDCHREQHRIGERTFWKRWDVEAMIEAFCKASPKASEIRAIRKEREGG